MIAIVKALLYLANHLAGFMHDRQLISAGEAQAVLKGIQEANDAINRAKRARNAVSESAADGGLHDADTNDRDNRQ